MPNVSPLFVTTRWSVVLAAGREVDAAQAQAALETLCRSYWYPLYAYVRRAGQGPHDAQDLTQEFFARLLAKEWLAAAAPEKGRFRTFLLVALKRFLANEWDRTRAAKRGGGQAALPLDGSEAEGRFASEPALAADALYERRWAMTLLESTLDRLRAEWSAAGKAEDFDSLKRWLTAARGEIPYAEMATTLSTTEGAARVALHRLRKRFRDAFREAVAATVAEGEDVEAEMRYLVLILSRV